MDDWRAGIGDPPDPRAPAAIKPAQICCWELVLLGSQFPLSPFSGPNLLNSYEVFVDAKGCGQGLLVCWFHLNRVPKLPWRHAGHALENA